MGRAWRIVCTGVIALAMAGCGAETGRPAADASADQAPDRAADQTPDRAADQAPDRAAGADMGPTLGLTHRPANATCRPPMDIRRPANLLSQTGCVDPDDPKKPAPGLIPYTVASPLWSDGSEKERFMALPDGARIHVKDCRREPATCAPRAMGGSLPDEGYLGVPEGTVLVKTFLVGGRRVETRLLIRVRGSDWVGYSYEWNDDETDARVHPDAISGVSKALGNGPTAQTWYYPSRADCLRCHIDATGVSLGLELLQLNIDWRYPSGVTSNQLATLEAIGLFDAPLPQPLPKPLPLPTDARAGTVEERARSYMHANCAICHRPESNFPAFDLRFSTSFADTKTCDALPEKGDLGVKGAKLVVPGRPDQSLMGLRMKTLGQARMPQLATSVVDNAAAMLVDEWVAGVSACP